MPQEATPAATRMPPGAALVRARELIEALFKDGCGNWFSMTEHSRT